MIRRVVACIVIPPLMIPGLLILAPIIWLLGGDPWRDLRIEELIDAIWNGL